jgi:hypothetical protein
MANQTIEFRVDVDDETAEAYRRSPEKDKQFLREMVSCWIRGTAVKRTPTLSEIARVTSREAERNGVTPEILAEILRD